MLRHSLLVVLSFVPFAGGHAIDARSALEAGACVNSIRREPLLLYEISGGTIAGPVDLHLTVFSDGSARIADLSDFEVPRGAHGESDVEAVADLMQDLDSLGARNGCDDAGIVTDVPLHTLTLLTAGTNARAHTYSWWLSEGANGAIEARIEQFVAEAFPGF